MRGWHLGWVGASILPMSLKPGITTVGVDMGGTKIAVGPFIDGQLFKDEILKAPTPQGDSDEILNTIASLVNQLRERHEVTAVGISTAGMVNKEGEMIGGCGNIKGWKGTKVKAELEKILGLEVFVENDANCAAYGEAIAGSGKGFDPALLVILGTGIGGGIVFNNKIWTGAHSGGGEIGHIKITDTKVRKCTCGAWDCWEAYGSGTGLQTTARAYFADPEMDNYKLMDLFSKGDETAIEVINRWHEYLAIGLSSVINSFDPAVVVLSGGMAQFVNYPKINKKVKEKVVDGLKAYVNIVEGVFENDSGMIGGACLANINSKAAVVA